VPRVDVVGLHLSNRKGAFADRANAALPLVGFGSIFFRELADVEVPFLTVKNEAINT